MKKLNTMENNPKKPWLMGLQSFFFIVLWVVILFFAQENVSAILKGDFVQFFKIPAKSMEPSIVQGDHIVVEKWFSKWEGIHREDVIVFPFPKDETRAFIKRVVGLPGEKLEIKKQQVFINGKALEEPYAFHAESIRDEPVIPRDDLGQIVIPKGMLFVLGDNRENSLDSRYFGFIEVSKVMGKVKMLYWSYDYKESQVRWNRVGKLVS